MYNVELHYTDTFFVNIPIGLWYSIVTMTSVGYGDMYPISPLGYVIGAMCALSGTLLLALTIPAVSNNFILYYTHTRIRGAAVKVGDEDPSHSSEGR